MEIKNLKKSELRPKATFEEITKIEKKYGISIPNGYKQVLLQSNGLGFKDENNFYFQISESEANCALEFYSLARIDFDFNMLKEDIEEGSNTYFYTDCLLPIAGTQYSGARVFIGYKDPYLDKIYYADYDVVNENNVPVLIKLADSLEDFFVAHGYYQK